jgi:hypothetical protein
VPVIHSAAVNLRPSGRICITASQGIGEPDPPHGRTAVGGPGLRGRSPGEREIKINTAISRVLLTDVSVLARSFVIPAQLQPPRRVGQPRSGPLWI